jgi:hypothetical protein
MDIAHLQAGSIVIGRLLGLKMIRFSAQEGQGN